jgi:methionine aminotransferase
MVLRERLSEKTLHEHGQFFDPDSEITITPGATIALFTVIATFIRPGDEVLYFDPAYDSYRPSVTAVGGTAISVPLHYPDFTLDMQLLKTRITPRTKMIILNTPHNPTGVTVKHTQLQELHELIKDTDIILMCDEVYEHVIFDQARHHSPLATPQLRERTVSIHSFGKMFNCTGWKTGYIIADKVLTAEIRKVHQNNAFSTFSPVQIAIAGYMEDPDTYQRLSALLQNKRDLLMEALQDSPLKPLPVQGSYFQLYSYQGFSSLPEKEFSVWLNKEAGVTSIPLSALAENCPDHQLIRFCFAKKDETLEKAAARLRELGRSIAPPGRL